MSSTLFVTGVTASSAAWANDADTSVYNYLSSVSGTNTITATGPNSMTAYAAGQMFKVVPAATNTGATTVNINAIGAKNVFSGGAACVGGELVASVPALIVYDGTQFNLIAKAITSGTSASTFTFNGSGGTSASKTITYQKVGSWVTLNIPATTATSGTSSTQFTADTALPAAIRPTASQVCSFNNILDNGSGVSDAGTVTITTAGVVIVRRTQPGATWTNASSCGTVSASSVTYFIG